MLTHPTVDKLHQVAERRHCFMANPPALCSLRVPLHPACTASEYPFFALARQ